MDSLEVIIEQNNTIIGLLTEIRNAIIEGTSIPITKEDREELEKVFNKKPNPIKVLGYTQPLLARKLYS